jgi:hypothetical protein
MAPQRHLAGSSQFFHMVKATLKVLHESVQRSIRAGGTLFAFTASRHFGSAFFLQVYTLSSDYQVGARGVEGAQGHMPVNGHRSKPLIFTKDRGCDCVMFNETTVFNQKKLSFVDPIIPQQLVQTSATIMRIMTTPTRRK